MQNSIESIWPKHPSSAPQIPKSNPKKPTSHWAFCVASCLPWPTNIDNRLSIWEWAKKKRIEPFQKKFFIWPKNKPGSNLFKVLCVPFFGSFFFGIFDENAWHTLANWSVMVSCLFLFLIDTEQKTLFLP